MKKTALLKDMLREIKKTRTRFLSITVMIMLGVFVLVGLKVTGPMMRDNGTMHAERQNMYDIKITEPVGIEEEDLDIVRQVEGLETFYAGKVTDLNWPQQKMNVTLESYSDEISTPEILEGRAPEKEGEILIENLSSLSHIKVGDQIEFSKEVDKFKDDDAADDLKTYKFTVVGKAISTDYIMQGIKGMSLSSGTNIDTVAYIKEENFNKEDYSFIKIRFKDLLGKDPESSSYKRLANERKNEIKDLLEPRAAIKLEDLKDKNYKKLNNAEADILDAKKQIADAEHEFEKAKIRLDDAKIKIDDARVKIADGKRELDEKETDARKKIADAKIKIEDGKKELGDAKDNLAKHEKDYEDGLLEYQDGLKKFEEAENEISDGEAAVKQGWEQALQGESQASSGLQEARAGLGQIEAGIAQLEGAIAGLKASPAASTPEVQGQISALEAQKAGLESRKGEVMAAINTAQAGLSQAASAKTLLKAKEKELAEAREQVEEKRAEIDDAKLKLEDARKKLDDAKAKLAKEEKKLLDGEAELREAELELETEVAKARTKIANAIIDFKKGDADYIEGKEEYEEKLADFRKKKEEAQIDIEDGEKKIADAKEILENLSEPRFIVKTRQDNDALYFLYESSRKLDIVSWIFPVFFFFIAILVSIATMTRMVEEDRIEIGTYKALGYGRLDIYKKYIIYGLISSVIGGVVGASAGSTILPRAIYRAYSASYVIKELQAIPNTGINLVAILFGVLANVTTIFLVINRTLRENAASLLRPKAPKAAKKILLERTPLIWNRLKFLNKVTLRNVFRYKSRMFMTIFGVAGCAGLVFLGFSLREAIGGIQSKQFEEIYKYDITITTDKSLPKDGLDELNKFLQSDRVDGYAKVRMEQLMLENDEGRDQSLILMVPEEIDEFKDYVILRREKQIGSPQMVDLDKPIISHKLNDYLAGDNIRVHDSNLKYFNIPLERTGLTDFYIGHMLFMPEGDYREFFEKDPDPNTYLVRLGDKDKMREMMEYLRKNPSVLTVSNFDDNIKIIEDWIGSIGIITIVILLCSAALAFVVLYNLTNINIGERLRELSTIKVLGFTTEELTSYIYRETIILSVIGIIVGFGVGWSLLGVVSGVLSPDDIQMNLMLTYKPYLFSAIITLAFVFIIRLIVVQKLRWIDMVESLKSYE